MEWEMRREDSSSYRGKKKHDFWRWIEEEEGKCPTSGLKPTLSLTQIQGSVSSNIFLYKTRGKERVKLINDSSFKRKKFYFIRVLVSRQKRERKDDVHLFSCILFLQTFPSSLSLSWISCVFIFLSWWPGLHLYTARTCLSLSPSDTIYSMKKETTRDVFFEGKEEAGIYFSGKKRRRGKNTETNLILDDSCRERGTWLTDRFNSRRDKLGDGRWFIGSWHHFDNTLSTRCS